MRGWFIHLALTLKSKTGLASGVLVWGMVAAGGAVATLGFFVFATFIALAERFGPLTAALVLGGLFLLVTIVALIGCVLARRRTAARAQRALAQRSHALWFDPTLLRAGLRIGNAIGWRKLASLGAIGIVTAGLAKEWIDRTRPAGEAG